MRKGDTAPDFELPDHQGNQVSLRNLLSRGPVVLFFFPTAMSGGCTEEVAHFQKLLPKFQAAGVAVLGASRDSVEKLGEFAHGLGVSFPLLSDVDELVTDDYGIKRRVLAKVLPLKRSTFVISASGKIVDVITGETNMLQHADEALAVVTGIKR